MSAAAPPIVCTCTEPHPVQRATRKGAASTYCARCDLPLPLSFGPR